MEDQKFEYAMLSRYQSDCRFYFGCGGRDAKYCLYYGDEAKQIEEMISLYGQIKVKPLWISMSDIIGYAEKMGVKIRNASSLIIRDRLVRAYQRLRYWKKLK